MNIEELAEVLRAELRDLGTNIVTAINETNSRIDQTNSRLDQTNSRLDQTNSRLDQTNSRLDQTNSRLDETILTLNQFAASTNGKLDGIGRYLQSIDVSFVQHERRITELERRMNRLDNAG